jgi:hypothetical protein
MRKREIGVLASAMAVASLVGGLLGGTLTSVHQASAQANTVTGGQITLTDSTGRARLTIAMTPDGQPSLTMADQNGITRVNLSLARDGSGNIIFNDSTGNPSSILP